MQLHSTFKWIGDRLPFSQYLDSYLMRPTSGALNWLIIMMAWLATDLLFNLWSYEWRNMATTPPTPKSRLDYRQFRGFLLLSYQFRALNDILIDIDIQRQRVVFTASEYISMESWQSFIQVSTACAYEYNSCRALLIIDLIKTLYLMDEEENN